MMNVLLLGYIAILALFVWLGLIPFNRFWKISPVIVAVALVVGLFIPMGWGAPQGSVLVLRNSFEVIPRVLAGSVACRRCDLRTEALALRQTKTPPERGFKRADARIRTADPFITRDTSVRVRVRDSASLS